MTLPVSAQAVSAAYQRIRAHVRCTPVLDLPRGACGIATALSLKLELFQHAGSFKTRGAFNTLLTAQVPPVGVAAASGGNHGAAVAFAAQQLGIPAHVFVPAIASAPKVAAIKDAGAQVHVGGQRYADAQEACDRHVAQTGALRVHPFDAVTTMEGAGTVALEWLEQTQTPDTVLVAVGGGGLVSGMATYLQGRVKVVGVEPEGSCALHAALKAGGPVDVQVESIAADSLGARNVGALVHSVASRTVDHVVLVPDAAIVEAQRALWQQLRIAAEPGGAAAMGALLGGFYRPAAGEKVGVLVCGGNVDLNALAALV